MIQLAYQRTQREWTLERSSFGADYNGNLRRILACIASNQHRCSIQALLTLS
jgi:hypothetical protein